MAMVLQQTLRGLCGKTGWSYAVFWKLKRRNRMVLTWEDCYYSFDTNVSEDPIGLAVSKMSYHVYSLGEGIIGRVSFSGKHQWVFNDNRKSGGSRSIVEKYPAGWTNQFAAGIQTIAIIAVVQGVVQLGSKDIIAEDLNFVGHVKDLFDTLQSVPGAFFSDFLPQNSVASATVATLPNLSLLTSNMPSLPRAGSFSRLRVDPVMPMPPLPCDYFAPQNQAKLTNVGSALQIDGLSTLSGHLLPNFWWTSPGSQQQDLGCVTKQALNLSNACGSRGVDDQSRLQHDQASCSYRLESPSRVHNQDTHLDIFDAQEIVGSRASKSGNRNFDEAEHLRFGENKVESEDFFFADPVYEPHGEMILNELLNADLGMKNLENTPESFPELPYEISELMRTPSLTAVEGIHWVEFSEPYIPNVAKQEDDKGKGKAAAEAEAEAEAEGEAEAVAEAEAEADILALEEVEEEGAGWKRPRFDAARTRPKDRQPIHDYIKELRQLVPNCGKCSIDTLLERTVKYVEFLKSVKQNLPDKQSLVDSDEEWDEASLALEVDAKGYCPIVVKNLKQPRQMLVKMVCEGRREMFVEIADKIRSMGLIVLRGAIELKNDQMWARFVVEATIDVHRVQVLCTLMHLLHQQRPS